MDGPINGPYVKTSFRNRSFIFYAHQMLSLLFAGSCIYKFFPDIQMTLILIVFQVIFLLVKTWKKENLIGYKRHNRFYSFYIVGTSILWSLVALYTKTPECLIIGLGLALFAQKFLVVGSNWEKMLGLSLISLLIYLGFGHYSSHEVYGQSGVYYIPFFLLVGCGLWFFYLNRYLLADFLYSYDQDNRQNLDKVTEDNEMNYLLHDLINQLHAISLFIGAKKHLQNGLTGAECLQLKEQVKLIQKLIKSNLHNNSIPRQIPFCVYEPQLLHLIDVMLPSHLFDVRILFQGLLDKTSPLSNAQLVTVPVVLFQRVFINLLKNVANMNGQIIYLTFNADDLGFRVHLSTTLSGPKNDQQLPQKLEKIILEEHDPQLQYFEGLGLESVVQQIGKAGGEFRFYYSDGKFINELYLPYEVDQESRLVS